MRICWFVPLLVLTVSGCCLDPVNGSRFFCLGEMSNAEEVALGDEYAAVFVAESGGVYPDPELSRYLAHIVIDKMALNSHRKDLPWTFTLLNTSDVNAFALPGGRVFCTRGLLARLESEAQFAHLMGHEIGHVSHKHSLRGQGRSALFALLLGAVQLAEDSALDPDDPRLISGAFGTLGPLAMLKFSRDQELESDQRGVDYALAAGYDPRQGKKTFEMFLALKRQSGAGESVIDGLLSTHPLDSSRIAGIDDYIRERYSDLPGGLVVSPPPWSGHLAGIQGANQVYAEHDEALAWVQQFVENQDASLLDRAEETLRSCAQRLPGHANFAIGLAVVCQQREDWSGAERHLDRAIRLDRNQFTAHLYRGLARQKLGQPARAREDLRRAHELNELHGLPCYLLGTVELDLGDTPAARSWFESAIERSAQGSPTGRRAQERLAALSQTGAE